jgi:hypothetical protein
MDGAKKKVSSMGDYFKRGATPLRAIRFKSSGLKDSVRLLHAQVRARVEPSTNSSENRRRGPPPPPSSFEKVGKWRMCLGASTRGFGVFSRRHHSARRPRIAKMGDQQRTSSAYCRFELRIRAPATLRHCHPAQSIPAKREPGNHVIWPGSQDAMFSGYDIRGGSTDNRHSSSRGNMIYAI